MKVLLSLTLSALCVSAAPHSRAAQASRRDAAAQSKEAEVVPVLQALEALLRQKGYARLPGFNTWQRLTSWKAEGCRVTYVITDEGVNTEKLGREPSVDVSKHSRFQFTLDLGDLDPRLVRVGPYRDSEGGSVSYATEGERKLVKFEARYLGGAADWRPRGWLVMKDARGLSEGAALLRRAAEICRGRAHVTRAGASG